MHIVQLSIEVHIIKNASAPRHGASTTSVRTRSAWLNLTTAAAEWGALCRTVSRSTRVICRSSGHWAFTDAELSTTMTYLDAGTEHRGAECSAECCEGELIKVSSKSLS